MKDDFDYVGYDHIDYDKAEEIANSYLPDKNMSDSSKDSEDDFDYVGYDHIDYEKAQEIANSYLPDKNMSDSSKEPEDDFDYVGYDHIDYEKAQEIANSYLPDKKTPDDDSMGMDYGIDDMTKEQLKELRENLSHMQENEPNESHGINL